MRNRDELIRFARDVARKYGIPEDIFLGLIESESGFNPDAVGPELSGGQRALGIAQFLPSTAKFLKTDPFDPFDALDAAGKYLAGLKGFRRDWQTAVARYKGFKQVQSPRAESSFSKAVELGRKLLHPNPLVGAEAIGGEAIGDFIDYKVKPIVGLIIASVLAGIIFIAAFFRV